MAGNFLTSARAAERELEVRKCSKSALYFLEKYWHIPIVRRGYKPWGETMYDYQKSDIAYMQKRAETEFGTRDVVLKARQIGWTTMATGFATWFSMYHVHSPWLIAQQGQEDASATLREKIIGSFNYLPGWMREHQRVGHLVRSTAETFELDNGSSILAIPSTSSSGRSKAVFGVLLDEAAFMENAAELYAAVDPLCYGPMFVFSTANGMGNFFHSTWQDSEEGGSEWSGLFHGWHEVPTRDESWYERQKRRFRKEPHLFYQEHPATPTEAFSRSGRTAFSTEVLARMDWPEPEARYDVGWVAKRWQDKVLGRIDEHLEARRLSTSEEADIELSVWQHPYVERDEKGTLLRNPNFVVAVDTSEGLEDGDYTAIAVWDANHREVVATLKAHVPVENIGPLAELLGYWYFTALVMPERNNTGLVPIVYLQDEEYPRLYRMDSLAAIRKGDRSLRYGWHTSRPTKTLMVNDMAAAIRNETVFLADKRFMQEAAVFLSDGKGGYGAVSPNHDDLIMATSIGLQGVEEIGEYPIVWEDPDPGPTTMGEVFGRELMIQTTKPLADPAMNVGIGHDRDEARVARTFELRR